MRALCTLVSLQAFVPHHAHAATAPSLRHMAWRGSIFGRRQLHTALWHGPAPPIDPRLGARRCIAGSAHAAAAAPAQGQPQVPLCERSAEYTAEMASLLAWREAALAAVEAVGDAWTQQDDGPSAEDLQVCSSTDV